MCPDNVRPFPVATNYRDGAPVVAYHPRLRAIEYLERRIDDGHAGVDPYDERIFVVRCLAHDQLRAVESVRALGSLISIQTDQVNGRPGFRVRAVLDDQARHQLRLNTAAPLMADEPLASRRADATLPNVTCPACRGTGGGVYNDCATCGGNGVVA